MENIKYSEENLLSFYKKQLMGSFLPFWHKAVDTVNGGVYTCFNNEGAKLLSTDKYTWSQGRFAWIWSKLHEMQTLQMLEDDHYPYLEQAAKTVEFLKRYAILDNGHCSFLLTETGEKKEQFPGKGLDSSIYADCFVVLGCMEYARVAQDQDTLAFALNLLASIQRRLDEGLIKSEPYPIPAGYESHGISMIMLNVAKEVAGALEHIGDERGAEYNKIGAHYMRNIMERFRSEDDTIAEMIADDPGKRNTILGRHLNPGHTLESMWFVMELAEKLGRQDYIDQAIKTIKRTYRLGWDAQYGGLLRYVDREGGKPQGERTGDPFEQLIMESDTTKLWWPHSEALYSLLYAYQLSGDAELKVMYEQIHEYTFGTFPNPDHSVGEWIQIRNRQGAPIEQLVALPVKDPYHIIRNMILIIESLDK